MDFLVKQKEQLEDKLQRSMDGNNFNEYDMLFRLYLHLLKTLQNSSNFKVVDNLRIKMECELTGMEEAKKEIEELQEKLNNLRTYFSLS